MRIYRRPCAEDRPHHEQDRPGQIDLQDDAPGVQRKVANRREIVDVRISVAQRFDRAGLDARIDGVGNVVTFTPVLNLTVDPSNDRPIGTPGVLRKIAETGNAELQRKLLVDNPMRLYWPEVTR